MIRIGLIGTPKKKIDSPMTGPERVFFNLFQQFNILDGILVENIWNKRVYVFVKSLILSKFDAYHVFHFGVSNLIALMIVKFLKRKPFYYTVHGLVYTEIKQGSKLNKHHLLVEYLLMKLSDKVFPVSKDLELQIIKRYKIPSSKIQVISNGVEDYFIHTKPNFNIYQQKLNANPKKKLIFTATGTQKIKGIESLLKTITLMKRDDFILVIAGPKGSIHNKIDRYIDNNKVHFIGILGREDLLSAYYYSDIYIQNSIYETFGLAPLEAMAQKKPIVISENVQLKNTLEHTQLEEYIIPYSEGYNKMLEEKIVELLDNADLRKYLGKVGFNIAVRNSWEKRAKDYIQAWNKHVRRFN